MKLFRLLIVFLFLLLPIAGRTIWYYQGIYQRVNPVMTPDFSAEIMPKPNLSTPIPEKVISKSSLPTVVLIDMTHTNAFMLSELETLTRNLANLGASIQVTSYSLLLEDGLKTANSLVVICPTVDFNTSEIEAIRKFVDRGGRLLVITDPTRDRSSVSSDSKSTVFDGVDIANLLLDHYEISVMKDYAYNLIKNEANFRNIIITDISAEIVVKGIKEVVFYSAHSMKTSAKGLFFGDKDTLSSQTDSGGKAVMAAISNDGNVLALGDLTFLTVPYNSVADNQQLTANIANFLVDGTRAHDLEDSPFLFSRPVSIIKSDSLKLDKNILEVVSTLQTRLKDQYINAQLSPIHVEENDLLVLGTYSQDEKEFLKKYIASYNLVFSNEPSEGIDSTPTAGLTSTNSDPTPTPTFLPTITPTSVSTLLPTITPTPAKGIDSQEAPNTVIVPGFGKMKTKDVGIILFSSTSQNNTAVLMASSNEALKELTSIMVDGLIGCTVQKNVAVCTVSSSGVDEGNSSFSPSNTFPTDIPTPSG